MSKQAYFRQLIQQCITNQLTVNYVLADSWFSKAENFRFVAQLDQHFVVPLEANHLLSGSN